MEWFDQIYQIPTEKKWEQCKGASLDKLAVWQNGG